MDVRSYFDLSKPVRLKGARAAPTSAVGAGVPAVGTPGVGLLWQMAIYFVLVAAIVASRFLDLYRAGALGQFQLDAAYLLFIAIVSLLAFPMVYDKAGLNKDRPILIQIALIFTAGMGWEKVVATVIGR